MRLGGYLQHSLSGQNQKLGKYLQVEGGFVVPYMIVTIYYDFGAFYKSARITEPLNGITLTWRSWVTQVLSAITAADKKAAREQANAWQSFVERALREEHVSFTIDRFCGVHYFVDQEFAAVRAAVLRFLGEEGRYAAGLHAFGLSFCKFGISARTGKANVGYELRRCYWTAITGRSAIWRERAQEIFQGSFIRIASLATRRISALGCLQLAVAAIHFVAEVGFRGQVHMRGYSA